MFTHESTTSLNKPGDLAEGHYEGRAVVYRMEGGAGEFVLSEFSLTGTGVVTFVEMLILAEGQDGVFYRDFLKLPDGLWRDSNGEKALSLAQLLPAATLSAKQVEATNLGLIQHVGGGQ